MAWVQILAWLSVGVLLGVLSGFMGVGGGIILTPLLLYRGMSPTVASVTSLAFILPTAWAGMLRGKDAIDVPLVLLLAVGAVVGTYAVGRPLVEACNLHPALYKRLVGGVLLLVALDLVGGFTDALKDRSAAAGPGPNRAGRVATPAPGLAPPRPPQAPERTTWRPAPAAHSEAQQEGVPRD
jgi:uncharacterized membrane protein YfcA